MTKSWYSIKNKANGTASIAIHDEIGIWGVTAKQLIADIKAMGDIKTIHLSIHSPGGSVFDGLAIYNTLKAHPADITATVEGIAASAASFVLMAADTIEMPEDSFIMIHNAHGMAFGGADDLRDMADLMEKIQGQIANIYQKRTGLDMDEIKSMMASETWMSAVEAQELGFADTVIGALGIAAKCGQFEKYFKALPVNGGAAALPIIENIRDLERHLRDSGYSRKQSTEIVAKLKPEIQRDAGNHAEQQQLEQLQAVLTRLTIPTSLLQD